MMRRELLRMAVALSGLALLGACATASSYQPRTGPVGSGYAEERIDETSWLVEFSGGAGDSREVVESHLLHRAAELTVSSGYDWFLPAAHEVNAEAEVVVEAQRARESPVWRPQWRSRRLSRWTDWMPAGARSSAASQPDAGQVRQVERFAAREEITMGRGRAPAGAFGARRVLSDLTPAIVRD
jgi:hypothetical protein